MVVLELTIKNEIMHYQKGISNTSQITQLAQQSTVISSVSKSQTFKYSGYQYHEQLSIMISAHLIAVNASV